MNQHWSKVKLENLDTRGINLSSPCDFKEVVRNKSSLKTIRLTFQKSKIYILEKYIKMYDKKKLSEFIIKALENDKKWQSNNPLQQSLKF